jgi:hypothetical protein
VAGGRHLEQELAQLEAKISLASSLADETQRAASSAERIASELEPGKSVVGEKALKDEREPSAAAREDEAITEPEEDISTRERAQASPAQEELRRVAEIVQEEDRLEEGVARTHAEAMAIAAAEAEALAEASSARTRKARIIVRQADQELTLVRATIRNGSLSGAKAQAALQAAERKSTHAHAELDDAEDAEERAINAARNAEAEAEVSEGMALSAHDRYRNDVQEKQQGTVEPSEEHGESTEKRPVVRSHRSG